MLFDVLCIWRCAGCRHRIAEEVERQVSDDMVVDKLAEILIGVDIDDISPLAIRKKLEEEFSIELEKRKKWIEQLRVPSFLRAGRHALMHATRRQIFRLVGQMESPSQISDYLYLGSFVSHQCWFVV